MFDGSHQHQAETMLEMFLDERMREQMASGVSLERMVVDKHGSIVRLMVDGQCVASAEVRTRCNEPTEAVIVMAYESNMRPMDIAGHSPRACIDAANLLGLETFDYPRPVLVHGKRIWFIGVMCALEPQVVGGCQLLPDGGDVHDNIIRRSDLWGCVDKCSHAFGEHFWNVRDACHLV